MNFNSMTNKAIAAEIGDRIEQLRLEHNFTQQQLADEIGLSRISYRKLVSGAAKFENIIAVLRVFNQLETIDQLIPKTTFSPMEQLKNKGKQRQRASKSAAKKAKKNTIRQTNEVNDEGLDW